MRVICLLLALLTISPAQSGETTETRVEVMLSRMTLEEKIGQLNMVSVENALAGDVVARGGAGSVVGFSDAAAIARIQELARTSRLGIPLLFGLDILHGFRILFPVPLGEAASFDPSLARRTPNSPPARPGRPG